MNEFFKALKNRRARHEFLKSVAIGIIAGALDFFIMAVIIYIEGRGTFKGFSSVFTGETVDGLPHLTPISVYLTANMLGFIASLTFNYAMCCFFVYQYGNVGRNKIGFVKFLAFALIGLTLSTVSSAIGYNATQGNVWAVKIIVTAVVAVFNFFTRKYFVFNIALIRDDENTIQL